MTLYRSFGFFIKDGLISVIDPRTGKVVMIRSANDVEDTAIYGRSLIDQYISDCIKAKYIYEKWVRHDLTAKQYHDWLKS